MKKDELPQDQSPLGNITKELCYVKDSTGKYTTGLSLGWDVKKEALENAWDDIRERVKMARQDVLMERKSPLHYYMELKLMDFQVLSGYTGFWVFSIKRHLRPNVFKKLSEKKLSRYASAFDISIDELKNFKV